MARASAASGLTFCRTRASNGIGSSGSPVAFITTGIGDAGAVAPGPALTIRDLGAGVAFPVTNYTAGTGALTLDGTFDTSVLGGTPTTIQAQVSLTAGGPPVAGCSACAWTNLSGYSATLRSGTIYNWSGPGAQHPGLCRAGLRLRSRRERNGLRHDAEPHQGRPRLRLERRRPDRRAAGNQGGSAISSFVGFWGLNSWVSPNNLDQGPPVVGNWLPAQTIMVAGDRFGVARRWHSLVRRHRRLRAAIDERLRGWPAVMINSVRDGVGITPEIMGGVTQSQTIGVGDGSTTTWCSASKFCASAGVSGAGPLYFTAAYQTGANLAGATVSGTTLIDPGRQSDRQHAQHVRHRARRSRARLHSQHGPCSERLPDGVLEYSPPTDIRLPKRRADMVADLFGVLPDDRADARRPSRRRAMAGLQYPGHRALLDDFCERLRERNLSRRGHSRSASTEPSFARTRARSPIMSRAAIARARASLELRQLRDRRLFHHMDKRADRPDRRVMDEHHVSGRQR